MPRAKKPVIAGYVEYQRIKVEVTLNEGKFYAYYGGTSFSDAVYDTLCVNLRNYIRRTMVLDWQPIIIVKELQPWGWMQGGEPPFIGFTFSRYRVAYVVNRWKRLDWDHKPDVQWADDWYGYPAKENVLRLPSVSSNSGHDGATYVLNYSEELWTALGQMMEALLAARRQLHGLLSTDEGLAGLTALGAGALRMLPAGTTQTEAPGDGREVEDGTGG